MLFYTENKIKKLEGEKILWTKITHISIHHGEEKDKLIEILRMGNNE